MQDSPIPIAEYQAWLAGLKNRVETARRRALLSVHRELVSLYWHLGNEILARQSREGWGARVIDRLAFDLRASYPDMKGFSPRNLKYMRALAEAWPDEAIVQQPAAQLPWSHLCTLLDRVKEPKLRDWYAAEAVRHGWSRSVLVMQIDLRLHERQGRAVSNFADRLPPGQSDLAKDIFKDPYVFDFLGLAENAQERDIESALTHHVTRFLLELGSGFAFVGRQYRLVVGGEEFYVDLLFYHIKLRCYIVVELKTTPFKPDYAGQLNFYLCAIDEQLKGAGDQPSVGLLLCRENNRLVAEYALRGLANPIGVAEYQLMREVPTQLALGLPSVTEIEAELAAEAAKLDLCRQQFPSSPTPPSPDSSAPAGPAPA